MSNSVDCTLEPGPSCLQNQKCTLCDSEIIKSASLKISLFCDFKQNLYLPVIESSDVSVLNNEIQSY